MMLRAGALSGVVLATLVATSGCTADPPTPAGSTAGSTAGAASHGPAPASAAPPALAFEAATTTVTCVESGGRTSDLALWDATMIASTPLTLTGVRVAEGDGVRVPGGLVAPVVGRLPRSIGLSDWPVDGPGRMLRRSIVWADRTPLAGSHLDVQRAVLPFLHLRARPGGSLRSVQVSYRTDAGQEGTATKTLALRFSRGHC